MSKTQGTEFPTMYNPFTPATVGGPGPDSTTDHSLPTEDMVSGLMQKKHFTKKEVTPWPADLVRSWSVVTMNPSDRLDVPWE